MVKELVNCNVLFYIIIFYILPLFAPYRALYFSEGRRMITLPRSTHHTSMMIVTIVAASASIKIQKAWLLQAHVTRYRSDTQTLYTCAVQTEVIRARGQGGAGVRTLAEDPQLLEKPHCNYCSRQIPPICHFAVRRLAQLSLSNL